MQLIFIYGPPAAGKLTVAGELSRLTGFRLFHNHHAIELAKEVLAHGSPGYGKLVTRLRLAVIEAAAEAGVSTIFTYVYEKDADDSFVDAVVKVVEMHGGEVCFVQLAPSIESLEQRVADQSRERFSKIKDWSFLQKLIYDHEVYEPVKYGRNLRIDNSSLPPSEVALQIATHYGLVDEALSTE